MKPYISLTLFLVLNSLLIKAQNDSIWKAVIRYNTISRKINISQDNGILLTHNLSNNGFSYQGLISKTDINGNKLWEKDIHTFDILHEETYNYIVQSQQDNNGNIYSIGGTKALSSNNDPFLIKLNACGKKEWAMLYYSPEILNYGVDLALAPDGNIVTLMRYLDPNASGTESYILKYSPEGELIWNCPLHSYAGDSNIILPLIRDIEMLPSGNTICAGECYYRWDSLEWFSSPYYACVSPDGEFLWADAPSIRDTVFLGGALKALNFPDTEKFIGLGEFKFEYSSPALNVYNANGQNTANYQSFHFDGYKPARYYSGALLNDSTLIASARWYRDPEAPDTLPYIEYEYQSLAVKLDTNGSIIKIKSLVSNEPNLYSEVAKSKDDKFYFFTTDYSEPGSVLFKLNSDLEYDSLQTDTNHYDPWCPGGIPSGAVEFYAEDFIITTATGELPKKPENKIQIAPNPAQGQINIRFAPLPQKGELLVFDLQGRMLATYPLPQGTEEYIISLESYKSGNYILQVVCGNEFVGARQFGVIQ